MNLSAKKSDFSKTASQCAIVFIAGKTLSQSAKVVDQSTKGQISQLIALGDLKEKCGSTAWVIPTDASLANKKRILIAQLGDKPENLSATDLKTLFASVAKTLQANDSKDAAVFPELLESIDTELLAHTCAVEFKRASYTYFTTKSSAKPKTPTQKLVLVTSEAKTLTALKKGLNSGSAVGEGINVARELGNLPGNICHPTYLAELAKTLAKNSANVKTKVLGEAQMEKLGMGSLLSVAAGSDQEGKLIVMEYTGNPGSKSKPHVLVGKGITFDTGGISLKPGPAMDEMKFDMCGAASVFGTMEALVNMKAKVNVVGIVAAAENMPSGRATKPGDVVTSMSGQTIEVLNTDAEGRLVLCDALTYAERFKPKSVVDIATLTGACVIALGSHATGLYANNDKLAESLLASGEKTLDRAWRMPLWDEYQKQLDSNFADIANIGGREAGSVTAACFLSRFTKKYPWAHLDIAGSAWNSGSAKGATGRPVALLVDYLTNN